MASGDGIDSLVFTTASTSGAAVVNLGAGNDTLEFGNSVSTTSILGGAGNDRVNFTEALTGTGTIDLLGSSNYYYYEVWNRLTCLQ